MRQTTLLLALLAALIAPAADRAVGASTNTISTTELFLDRVPEPIIRSRTQRRLEARNDRFNKHGWMVARTELSPERGFTFTVLEEGGSGYILGKVLRPILEGEQEINERGDGERSAFTADNYDLIDETAADDGLVRLELKPKRKEKTLVVGALFVTPGDADLVRLEGRLAKGPSFWTPRVEIVRRYGRIAGMRVPLSVQSIAHVRIAGRSTMTMTYEYEMVNGIVPLEGRLWATPPDGVEAP